MHREQNIGYLGVLKKLIRGIVSKKYEIYSRKHRLSNKMAKVILHFVIYLHRKQLFYQYYVCIYRYKSIINTTHHIGHDLRNLPSIRDLMFVFKKLIDEP
jgi:hypothetical protein